MKRTIFEVTDALKVAQAETAKNQKAVDEEKEKLKPLEIALQGSMNAEANLKSELHELTAVDEPVIKKRAYTKRGIPMKKGEPKKPKPYNISPETKIAATYKRVTTRAINAGKSKPEAMKLAKAAAKHLKEKLGIK